jgi:hypothetical protein
MLKEYLTEAVSLLAEAVLGHPTPAMASSCVAVEWRDPCTQFCGGCGTMKRMTERWCRICNGHCWWAFEGCFCYWC